MVESKAVARFECRVRANPFTEETVRWDLPDRPGGPAAWEPKKEVRYAERINGLFASKTPNV